MNSKFEFDSEYCNVKYLEKENVVLLRWKKFCSFEDYRNPATFALELLKGYPNSNLVVDARNGFEDVKEDAEWGFNVLLPNMAKTDCKYVVFIMDGSENVDDEIDMWTKEFGKYFAVTRVNSFEDAINALHSEILLHVTYKVKKGTRERFIQKVKECGIITSSKQEPGNLYYEYYFPIECDESILLIESWTNAKAIELHMKADHYKLLTELKKEYVEETHIRKFFVGCP